MAQKLHRRGVACLLVLAVFALTGCAAPTYVRTGPVPPRITANSPLTVMSFNIRLGLGREDPHRNIFHMRDQWGRGLGAVVEAIRSADPDIVGLQEVAGPEQLWKIAQVLDMNHAFVWHETGSDVKPWSGVGLLSKYPITSSTPAAMSDNRNFIIATIDAGTKKISVVNIHRWHLESSEDSMQFLMGELGKRQLPTLLMGDFNILPGDKTLKDPGRKRLQPVLDQFVDSAEAARTKEAEYVRQAGTWHGGGRIDYVFAEKGRFSVLDAGLVAASHRDASDHIAYFAKLIFKE